MAYIIDRFDPDQQFIHDRAMAVQYLDKFAKKVDGTAAGSSSTHKYLNWVKTEPSYPAFEDFTFSYRNQVFPVLVLRADDKRKALKCCHTVMLQKLTRKSGSGMNTAVNAG